MSSFHEGGTKLDRFLPKDQHIQKKLLNFENWFSGELSNMGHYFRKQRDSKINVIKKCAPKLTFFNEKKMVKDSNYFRHRKCWHFLRPPHFTNSQNSTISFEHVDF